MRLKWTILNDNERVQAIAKISNQIIQNKMSFAFSYQVRSNHLVKMRELMLGMKKLWLEDSFSNQKTGHLGSSRRWSRETMAIQEILKIEWTWCQSQYQWNLIGEFMLRLSYNVMLRNIVSSEINSMIRDASWFNHFKNVKTST